MEKVVDVRPLGPIERFLDWVMIPLMYLLSGTVRESPQRTHRWNNTKLGGEVYNRLSITKMVLVEAVGARHLNGLRRHLTIVGGWKEYVVIEPVLGALREDECEQGWHVGWKSGNIIGVSRIPLQRKVRLLLGPDQSAFFGIAASDGRQIQLRFVGYGRIGDGGPHCRETLC